MKKIRNKKNNYDTTGYERVVSRRNKIKKSNLVERTIIMDVEDKEIVQRYATNLYEKKGKKLIK